jgi:beta-xylosidase
MRLIVAKIFLCLLCLFVANNPDNTYTNPIIDADYSDPDVIRVGDDFYLTSRASTAFPVCRFSIQKIS